MTLSMYTGRSSRSISLKFYDVLITVTRKYVKSYRYRSGEVNNKIK